MRGMQIIIAKTTVSHDSWFITLMLKEGKKDEDCKKTAIINIKRVALIFDLSIAI